jgi:hypothetical protein
MLILYQYLEPDMPGFLNALFNAALSAAPQKALR